MLKLLVFTDETSIMQCIKYIYVATSNIKEYITIPSKIIKKNVLLHHTDNEAVFRNIIVYCCSPIFLHCFSGLWLNKLIIVSVILQL